MKIISILAILSGLLGLACSLLNWALYFFSDGEEIGSGTETLMNFTWLGDSVFIGLAVLLTALGLAIQSFKKKDPTQPTT